MGMSVLPQIFMCICIFIIIVTTCILYSLLSLTSAKKQLSPLGFLFLDLLERLDIVSYICLLFISLSVKGIEDLCSFIR